MAIRGILAIQGGGGEQLEWCGGAISCGGWLFEDSSRSESKTTISGAVSGIGPETRLKMGPIRSSDH
jgi:hypothetical protein